MAADQPFVLGVNYWPRRKAMYWWSDFDEVEVREEFSLIADLGLRLVRLFLLWDDWQPTPDAVRPSALNNLEKVADIAADLGLKLDVTFFTGHMSGPNWAPGWMLLPNEPLPPRVRQLVSGGRVVDCGYRNPYSDPLVLGAAQRLVKEVVMHLREHPAIGVWNLGNEPDLFAWPANAAAGKAWVKLMTTIISDIDPWHPVTCGLHADSLVRDNGHRVHDVFGEVDWAVMHGYPMYAEGWSEGPLDPDFVPFLCALTSALNNGKPTLMEEFGGCTAQPGQPSHIMEWQGYGGQTMKQFMASEEDLAAYIEQVLPRLVEVGSTGAVLWCFADYHESLWDRPPCSGSQHERFFGLIRPDGSLKPHAHVLKRFAATNPTVKPATRVVDLDITPEEYYADPFTHAVRLYRAYMGRSS